MSEPLAFLNGRWLPASQAQIAPTDAGFVLGVTIAEQLRTFRGRLFRLEDHLARLWHGLDLIGVDPGLSLEELALIADRLAEHNHGLLNPGDDLGLAIFVTPGPYAGFSPSAESRPTVCVHSYPLAFGLWAEKYRRGEHLVIAGLQPPAECWPPTVKCRSRMHYYLAGRQANAREPGAKPLLCDGDGFVLETPTANLVIYRESQGLLTPPRQHVLPGVSLAVLLELAAELDIPWREQRLRAEDVTGADEVLLTSTPWSVLPAIRGEGKAIGNGQPGPVYRRLLEYWNQRVGMDMAEQALRFADRRSRPASE